MSYVLIVIPNHVRKLLGVPNQSHLLMIAVVESLMPQSITIHCLGIGY
jgi:hypothetical protein